MIIRYRTLLVSGGKFTGFNSDQSWTDETLDELQSPIEGLLERAGVKLVIIVDNSHRVGEKPARLHIIQLVKLLGEFKKTV